MIELLNKRKVDFLSNIRQVTAIAESTFVFVKNFFH